MKKQELFYIVIMSLLLFNTWAQQPSLNKRVVAGESQIDSSAINSKIDTSTRKIKYYRVEEITNMNFGGRKIVYKVSDPKLVNMHDLGPNNKRIITPVFVERKQPDRTNIKLVALSVIKDSSVLLNTNKPKEVEIHDSDSNIKETVKYIPVQAKHLEENTIASVAFNKTGNASKLSITDTVKKVDSYANIDISKTYERVIGKGYESLEMLKKTANLYFFNNELEKAEKLYYKLFNMTTDLEPDYYYRYSLSLKAIGEINKANEFLEKFDLLSRNKTAN